MKIHIFYPPPCQFRCSLLSHVPSECHICAVLDSYTPIVPRYTVLCLMLLFIFYVSTYAHPYTLFSPIPFTMLKPKLIYESLCLLPLLFTRAFTTCPVPLIYSCFIPFVPFKFAEPSHHSQSKVVHSLASFSIISDFSLTTLLRRLA